MAKKKKKTTGSKNNKPKTTTKKKTTVKNNNKPDYSNVIDEQYTNDLNLEKILWTIGIVLFIMLVFYFFATLLTDYKFEKKDKNADQVSIQYTEILAGSTYNRKESEYLVVYYDWADEENKDKSEIASAVSSYESSPAETQLYTCNLGSGFNKNYVVEGDVNTHPDNAKELKFNGPTLIRIKDGGLAEYIQGKEAVVNYLNNLHD